MAKAKSNLKKESNPTVYDRIKRRAQLSCSICPPNQGENASRKPKHGAKKPKGKDKRK